MHLARRALALAALAVLVMAGTVHVASAPQYPDTTGRPLVVTQSPVPVAPVPDAAPGQDAVDQDAVDTPVQQKKPGAPPPAQTGVIALQDGGIMLVDARTFLTYGPYLDGELGTPGGGLLDVVVSKTGTKAFVSNFGDSRVNFIDLRRAGNPNFIGAVTLDFFAEDMALSPNQKFLLVTDGGLSSKISVIKVATRTVVGGFDLDPFSADAQSVDIAKDNKTVAVSDYIGHQVCVLTMNPLTGALGYVGSIGVGTQWPVNTTFSPNGKTLVAASGFVDANPVPGDPVIDMGAVFRVNGPGNVEFMGNIVPPDPTVGASQSVVFNRKGTKLYWLASKEEPDPDTGLVDHVVYVYNVVGPGVISYSGVEIPIADFGGSGAYFGVDAMAIDPTSEFLYVSNKVSFGTQNKVAVINLKTNRQVLSLVPGPVGGTRMPMGIAFK